MHLACCNSFLAELCGSIYHPCTLYLPFILFFLHNVFITHCSGSLSFHYTKCKMHCLVLEHPHPPEGSYNFCLFILLLSIPSQWTFWLVRLTIITVLWKPHSVSGISSHFLLSKSYPLQRSSSSLTSSINSKDGLRWSWPISSSIEHLQSMLLNNIVFIRSFLVLVTTVSWDYQNSLITGTTFYTFIALFPPSTVPGPSNCILSICQKCRIISLYLYLENTKPKSNQINASTTVVSYWLQA